MSLGDSRIPEDKALKAAEEELRLKVGNLPHLGAPSTVEGDYVIPILISLPRVVFDADTDEAIEVRFLSEEEVGEIRVSGKTGEVVDRTDLRKIESRINEKEKEVERAIQRALIKASAKEFSLLPYSGHRFNPTVEILSELILSTSIEKSRLRSMGDRYDKYTKRLDVLEECGLVREEEGTLVAGDKLTTILSGEEPIDPEKEDGKKAEKPHEQLNVAMMYLFEEQASNLDLMNEVLGPHLEIASFYYQRAIRSQELPKVSQAEIRREFGSSYSGKQANKKRFQASRILLQLEQVGILESTSDRGERMWRGSDSVKEGILDQKNELEPIAEIAPA